MSVIETESKRVQIIGVRESVDPGLWIIDCQPVEHPGQFQLLTKQAWRAALCERRMQLAQTVIVTWAERRDYRGIWSGFKNLVKVELVPEAA